MFKYKLLALYYQVTQLNFDRGIVFWLLGLRGQAHRPSILGKFLNNKLYIVPALVGYQQ